MEEIENLEDLMKKVERQIRKNKEFQLCNIFPYFLFTTVVNLKELKKVDYYYYTSYTNYVIMHGEIFNLEEELYFL